MLADGEMPKKREKFIQIVLSDMKKVSTKQTVILRFSNHFTKKIQTS